MKLDKSDPETYNGLALLYAQHGDSEEATKQAYALFKSVIYHSSFHKRSFSLQGACCEPKSLTHSPQLCHLFPSARSYLLFSSSQQFLIPPITCFYPRSYPPLSNHFVGDTETAISLLRDAKPRNPFEAQVIRQMFEVFRGNPSPELQAKSFVPSDGFGGEAAWDVDSFGRGDALDEEDEEELDLSDEEEK